MGRRIFVEPALPPVPAMLRRRSGFGAQEAGRWLQEERGEALGVEAAGVEAAVPQPQIFVCA